MTKLSVFISIFILAFTILSCQTKPADPTDFESAHINGMVYSRGNNACANAAIKITASGEEEGKSKIVYSDVYGRFSIPELAKGRHTITVSKAGFETNQFSFVFSNRTQSIYIYLLSEADLIETLEEEMKAKNYQTALKTGNRILDLNPDSSRGLFLTAGASMKLEDYDGALDLLSRLLALEPDSIWPVLLTADIYQFHLDDPSAALDLLEGIHNDKRDDKLQKRITRLKEIVGR